MIRETSNMLFITFIFLAISISLTSSTMVNVDPQLKDSVEDFLKMTKENSSAISHPSPKFNRIGRARPEILNLLEILLRNIYDSLYGNQTQLQNGRSLSPRQSFFSNGLASLSEYLMSLVENSLEDLPSFPRMEPQECMKRSVCEAHNQPKKYGLMGLILQLLFPPYTKTEDPNNLVSKYQLAARYGRQNNANCGVQYDGCVINLLDIIQALVNTFIR